MRASWAAREGGPSWWGLGSRRTPYTPRLRCLANAPGAGATGSQKVPRMKKIQHFLPHCNISQEHARAGGSRRLEVRIQG